MTKVGFDGILFFLAPTPPIKARTPPERLVRPTSRSRRRRARRAGGTAITREVRHGHGDHAHVARVLARAWDGGRRGDAAVAADVAAAADLTTEQLLTYTKNVSVRACYFCVLQTPDPYVAHHLYLQVHEELVHALRELD